MSRVLKPSPRPYVALGIVLGGVALIAILPILAAGKPWQALQATGGMLLVYAAFGVALSRQRVVVESDSITFHELFKPTSRVLFRDISRSVPRILGEPEHPLGLDIYADNAKKPALRLRLKSFRAAEVAWLVSIPDLKVQK